MASATAATVVSLALRRPAAVLSNHWIREVSDINGGAIIDRGPPRERRLGPDENSPLQRFVRRPTMRKRATERTCRSAGL